ncbi:hypothetical protein L6164_008071 [Bauhinia variegata]|uniref:Uncharacterized protein n=1 Tax=Bauhinia variegata TaxID=167791 RepID=A0ACB9PFW5_BAUVA|nr:hypothetical protein L6164_008071 [Bauhinia variegata]
MRKPCCCEKEETNKGPWSKQEDQKLMDYIKEHGEGCWRWIPRAAGLRRCGKSCRLRWLNYLKPEVKHGDFGEDEEDLIIRLHALLGNRGKLDFFFPSKLSNPRLFLIAFTWICHVCVWALIAGRLPGRSDNEIKHYWNSHIKKKLERMGHDPNNLHGFKSSVLAISKPFGLKTNEVPKHVSFNAVDSQVLNSSTGPDQCNISNFPDLNLDLTLSTSSMERETEAPKD